MNYFEINSNCGVSPLVVWDALKVVLQGKIISMSSAHNKQKQKYREELLMEKKHKETCSEKVYHTLLVERKKLDPLEINRIRKNLLFTKQKYWLHTPKSLKLLSWKVRTQQSAQVIHAVKDNIQTDTKDILSVFTNFYSTLYPTCNLPSDRIAEYLKLNFKGKCSTKEHVELLDAPISTDEVTNIIRSLKNNKAPGDEGFNAEFYKRYSELLSKPLMSTFNNILTSGSFPPSWSSAMITVIPKKGRDTLNPKSYCPISLLNQDYKIVTALLVKRLNKIIGYYISPDQTPFIPSRDTVDNIHKTLNIIHYCTTQVHDSSLILSLDIEKAFDSVESGYLMEVLEHMAFGPNFRTAIQAIYKQPIAKIQVNGSLSSSFQITRGRRQGCPLSPLLFALTMESVAETLQSSSLYTGVQIGRKHFKLSLFADNMALYVTKPMSSLLAIGQMLDDFQLISGLHVNKEKSLIYPM